MGDSKRLLKTRIFGENPPLNQLVITTLKECVTRCKNTKKCAWFVFYDNHGESKVNEGENFATMRQSMAQTKIYSCTLFQTFVKMKMKADRFTSGPQDIDMDDIDTNWGGIDEREIGKQIRKVN